MTTERQAVFGFPDVWNHVYAAHENAFRAIDRLSEVAEQVVAVTQGSQEHVQQVLRALTQVNLASMNDILILDGNKRGTGAMKVARSALEVSLTAEYLEKNPREALDYLDFAVVVAWRWEQKHASGKLTTQQRNEAETEYNRVKPRFTNAKGRVRNNWTTKTIRQIAEDVGRGDLYDLVYNLASALHHVNAAGLIAHELDWVAESLRIAHGSLLQTVCSLCNVSDVDVLAMGVQRSVLDFENLQRGP